ncbi:hypothetical protein EYR40_004773 [Pleurotus pulmonarius]|nr:hypothetical protein EYR36_006849 [Pleurotus pulmonarius]KAF4601540.1 hypothetical protein EYR38_006194 [Pleurotus pulmonarius]KAF4601575.1 hypothetical protein EYR40_004773 [Pleurotus pulmonarius]
MRLLQSPHLNDFSEFPAPGLTPERMDPADARSKDDTTKGATVDRIMEFLLRSTGLKRSPVLSLSTLTSLSLSAQVRQPYEEFSSMLRGMTALRQLTIVNSLPWSIPGPVPALMGCTPKELPQAPSPLYASGLSFAGNAPSGPPVESLETFEGPFNTWITCEGSEPSESPTWDQKYLPIIRSLLTPPVPVYPLVLPSTLRELTVHDHGFRCVQFFAIVICQLARLEIKCITDGFDPLPLFSDSARLFGHLLPEGAVRELFVRSESDKLLVQFSRSDLAYNDKPMAETIVQPTLSIALDFSADDKLPSLAVYESIITTGINALPLYAVRRASVDFHVDFRGAWFAGFFQCLHSLESLTLRREAMDGFLKTHVWMAYNDPMVAMIPFKCLKTVFAEWDTRWPQARADADIILRYLNAGGVFMLFWNVGGHAEGFVRGPVTPPKGLGWLHPASRNRWLCF